MIVFMTNIALATQGDVSIIPTVKIGTGGAFFGVLELEEDDVDIYGVAAELLYEAENNLEVVLGAGIDKNEFDENDDFDFIII